QLNTWFALTLYWRATTETDAPGNTVAATISRFNASGHRLLRRRSRLVSIIAFVDTSTSHPASDQRKNSANPPLTARRPSPEGNLLHASPQVQELRGAQCLPARSLRRLRQGPSPSRAEGAIGLRGVRGRAAGADPVPGTVRRLPCDHGR